uniref:CCHC-type domain-containing protein n=1 Tax=Tanacetum cinerariifolium TaxID=118510 RepID=A0A6L2KBQ7_TANCI|nr:hypothetical protein [Tanacetum cinerariifolium]
MANDKENHALVADEEAPTEFSLMAKTSAESKDLELLKKEKGKLETNLTGFQTASKDLDSLLESQRLDKNKERLGYNDVPPPPAQVYSPPNKDMSWTGLFEFKDNTVTDYSRPSPAIESTSYDVQNRNTFVTKTEPSPSTILPKPFIKFVKASDSLTKSKTDKVETAKKHAVKYAERYIKSTKKPNVRGNQMNLNNLKSHQLGANFVMKKKACFNCGEFDHLAYDCCKWVTSRSKNNTHKRFTPRPAIHRPYRPTMRSVRPNMNAAQPNKTSFYKPAHSYTKSPFQRTSAVRSQYRGPRVTTVNRKFPTINRKLPTVNRKFPTGNPKFSTVDLGNKGKAGSSQNNIDYKVYWDSDCSRHMIGNISYLSDYEPFNRGYVSFGQGGCKITGKGTIKIGRDFKLFNDANVFLRTPRQHNMYSIDLNNIAPHKDLTCLVAKASVDECMLWHRRLGQLNFKTMNKLVRHNLVRGLPTKCFENDHTCTASLKGKQHKASFNKSYNKTPYELFNGRTPVIGFLKPFGCYVMILNTLYHLEKFKAKGDEGYFIGYSMSSKAFRVFNKRTEENLHVDFLENKAIEKGAGLNWLFDIDSLTNSMNYVPMVGAGTHSTNFSGTKDAASQEVKKDVSSLRYIALPNWVHDALLESTSSNAQDTCKADAPKSSENLNPTASTTNPLADQMKTLTVETPIPTVSSPVPTACLNDSLKPSNILGVTKNSVDSDGVEADVSNIETTITSIPTPTLRIHKDHPKSQIIGPVDTPIQTRNKSKEEEGIDYDEVFAPVARIEAIRLFLAYASFIGFTVYQMDVKSAFLYGTIHEEVYVMQPPGFQDPKYPARVYEVEKAIEFEALMHEKFQMSAMGQLNFFFGLQVLQKKDDIFLSQDKLSMPCEALSKEISSFLLLLYALTVKPTVYVSHIRQFWSTARIETTEEGTKILTTVDGILRTVTESSFRRNLKLKDEEGISEACPTDSGFEADQDRANIAKSSTLPYDSAPRVTSPAADDGSMQQTLHELTALCTSLQRQHSEMVARFEAQGLEIASLKVKIQVLEDKMIETTEEGTKILATVDGKLRTMSESSIRRNLKLNDEEGIRSLPDAELFENPQMMGYNILPNQKFTFQKRTVFPSVEVSHSYHHAVLEQILHTHTYVVPFHTRKIFTTLRVNSPSFSGRIVPLFDSMLVPQGEGSGTPIESHHTPTYEASQSSQHELPSPSLPPVLPESLPTIISTDIPPLRQYTKRTRIAQSLVFPPVADEPASPLRDDSQGEAYPTDSGFEADQDRVNIAKTSTLPSDSTSRVTSLTTDEGKQSGDDAPIKGRSMDEREEAAKKRSNDTEEMINVLTSMDAATVLSSGVAKVPTGSGSIPTADPPATGVPTGTDVVPTAGPISATATMLEEEMERDAQRMNEQIARDAEIARIHAEEELQMLIDGLDRNNETKQLQDFIPLGSKEEAERFKRKGLRLEQESVKKLKTSEEVKETEEVPEDKVKEMMQLVPIEEVYVDALQVKHHIIDWKKKFPLLVKKFPLLKKSDATAERIALLSEDMEVEEETNTITFSLLWASKQPVTRPKAPTDLETKKKKIPSSSQPKSPHKVRVILPKKQVAETQHAEVTVATADATKSLKVFELAEEQGNQPSTADTKKEPEKIVMIEEDAEDKSMEILTVEQLLDLINKKVQETPESPYNTESEINVVNSYFTSQIPKLKDQIMHDSDESAEYESMPKDDLRSVLGFEGANSDNTQGNDVSHSDYMFPDHNAFAEHLSLSEYLDHICEEVSSLHSKLGTMESSIIHQVSDGIQSTLIAFVNTALQEQLPGILLATLKDCLPSIIQESLFAKHETELSKTLKTNMGKSVTTLVKFGMKEVRDDLKSQAKSLGKFSLDVQSMQTQLYYIQSLLESAVIIDDTAGGKNKKAKNPNPNICSSQKNNKKSIQEFTDQLFKTTSTRFSPTPPRELTPPRDSSKGKVVAIIEELRNELKWTEHEAKNSKMMQEYKHQISFRADTRPITKISYVVNSRKEATMKITKGDNPLNLVVQPNFRPKTLGFSKWLEVINQAKRIGLPSLPELATFRLSAEEKKRKRTELIKYVFVTEKVMVNGMDRNLIPTPAIL